MGAIQNYLFDKQNGVSQEKFEAENFTAYPLDVVDDEGNLREGFLQDADTQEDTLEDGVQVHTLEVLWLEKSSQKVFAIKKTCKAPATCLMRWDEVHCSFNLSGIDFES